VALLIGLYAGVLEAELVRLGHATHGPNQVVHVREGALALVVLVVHGQLARGRVLVHACLDRLLMQVYAQPFVLGRHALLDHGVEGPQEGVVPDEQVRLHAQGVEHARKLHSDVSRAHERDLLRQRGDVEEAVTVGAVFGAGDIRRASGAAADSDQDAVRADGRLSPVVFGDLDFVLG